MTAGGFRPAPAAAPLFRMVSAQAALELRLMLRNGEQLLLIVVIPTLLLLLLTLTPLLDLPADRRVDFLAPGILALAIMSTAFTGQAIATGFERRYGVLKRLGATPLPRWGLLVAKTAAVLVIEAMQVVLLVVTALLIGWSPGIAGGLSAFSAALLVLVGTAAFSGLGLLLAGTLRAEATLAAANLVYVVFLVLGGVVFPLDRFPAGPRAILELLPVSALASGLRRVMEYGLPLPTGALTILACWAAVAIGAAALTFRWE